MSMPLTPPVLERANARILRDDELFPSTSIQEAEQQTIDAQIVSIASCAIRNLPFAQVYNATNQSFLLMRQENVVTIRTMNQNESFTIHLPAQVDFPIISITEEEEEPCIRVSIKPFSIPAEPSLVVLNKGFW